MGHACGCHDPGAAGGAGAGRVLVDVREDIRRGAEPLARILAAVEALGADQVMVLRAPFEPVPLYRVLAERGFAHSTERRGADDWWITFSRDPAAAAGPRATLDVRGLEPPEPMVRVLESADRLAVGGELVVIHDRRPIFLYPQLEARGFAHETEEPEAGVVRIRIRRPGP
jgi:uncharacterized protein (DUF2249 family)